MPDATGQPAALSAEDDAAYFACHARLRHHDAQKLHQLFAGGDYTPGKTPSDDDRMLALLLIKGGIRQAEQVERIMRASAIARTGQRGKWDRRGDNYLARTIRSAAKKFKHNAGEAGITHSAVA